MSEGTVRQLCRMFKGGRKDVHVEERSCRSSVSRDDILSSERRLFTISELLCGFIQISRNVLYEVITVRLGYHKFCARLFPKTLTGAHKTQRIASVLTF
jgi:hypothetical protein